MNMFEAGKNCKGPAVEGAAGKLLLVASRFGAHFVHRVFHVSPASHTLASATRTSNADDILKLT